MSDYNCPYCKYEISWSFMYSYFTNAADFQTYFDFECPSCTSLIEVEVEAVPEFHLRSKEVVNT